MAEKASQRRKRGGEEGERRRRQQASNGPIRMTVARTAPAPPPPRTKAQALSALARSAPTNPAPAASEAALPSPARSHGGDGVASQQRQDPRTLEEGERRRTKGRARGSPARRRSRCRHLATESSPESRIRQQQLPPPPPNSRRQDTSASHAARPPRRGMIPGGLRSGSNPG